MVATLILTKTGCFTLSHPCGSYVVIDIVYEYVPAVCISCVTQIVYFSSLREMPLEIALGWNVTR